MKSMIRPALTALALTVAGCGGSHHGTSATATTAQAAAAASAAAPTTTVSSPALDRCAPASQAVAAPPGVFPDGLLPQPSRVVGTGQDTARAIVALPLRDTLLALRTNGVKLGYRLGAQDYEGIEAELELQGDADGIELQLKPAPGCPAATQVTSAPG